MAKKPTTPKKKADKPKAKPVPKKKIRKRPIKDADKPDPEEDSRDSCGPSVDPFLDYMDDDTYGY